MTGYLCLTKEEAEELWGAIGTKLFLHESQGKPVGRLKNLQGRVDNIWAELDHAEKVRSGYTGQEIRRADAVEGLAPDSDFIPYA